MVKVCGEIPTVLCGNKVDVKEISVTARSIRYRKKLNTPVEYCEVSAQANYNFERPFLMLARKLVGKPDLEFTETIHFRPAQREIDDRFVMEREEVWSAAVEESLSTDNGDGL